MACLAEGRAVTLTSSNVGGSVACTHATGAYAHIRRQFRMPIAYFGGIEEVLARIGGNTYLIDAGLRLTLDHMNLKQKSAIAAAIVKYHVTERGRIIINDAMDIHGGKCIMLGPTLRPMESCKRRRVVRDSARFFNQPAGMLKNLYVRVASLENAVRSYPEVTELRLTRTVAAN